MHRGTNQLRLGDFNQRVVLDCVRRSPEGISRVEIAHHTGLSVQTISTLVRRLLEDGLVREAGRKVSGPGKPRTLIQLNPGGWYAAGVHLDPVRSDICLLDMSGVVVERATVWLDDQESPEQTLERIADQIAELIDRDPRRKDRVAGLGVGAPGPLDWDNGTMINPPILPLWRQVPLAEQLSARLDLLVLLEKDVIAAAAGEGWLTRAQSTFLFAYLGAGIGIGLVSGGDVQRGNSHNFGEVGHLVVGEGGPALACCGRRGTIGARSSMSHLTRRAQEVGLMRQGATSVRNQNDAISVLGRAAAEGHPDALAIVDDLARDLAVALSLLSDLLDVGDVVLGGHICDAFGQVLTDRLGDHLSSDAVPVVRRAVRLHGSQNPTDVVPVGAATMVLDDLLSPRSSTLSTDEVSLAAPEVSTAAPLGVVAADRRA